MGASDFQKMISQKCKNGAAEATSQWVPCKLVLGFDHKQVFGYLVYIY